MNNTLTDKEVKNLIIIGNRIYKSLECGDGEHIPCRTDRLEAVKNMKEYLEIHNYKVSEEVN